jgi:ferredoxin-NADP reductase
MFNLKLSNKPAVFLTGGVGVAAIKPIIKSALNEGFSEAMYLFNSNRNFKDIPYFKELKSIKNTNFHYIPTLTKKAAENSNWPGERGYIDQKMIAKYIKNPEKAIYFLVGPPAFMWGMYKLLQEIGIKESNINFDEFTGY